MNRTIAKALSGAFVALFLAVCVGCSATPSDELVTSEGEPPLMPATHEGRYEELGMAGCYGCHGVNADGETMNAYATALPDDHYVDGDPATGEVYSLRGECITCHPQG